VVEPLADARLLSLDAGYVEVAHEALFREWPRLRAWLEEHATAGAVQHRLAVAAAEWDDGGREPTELWRGGRLAAGTEFAATYPDEVTTVERAFLDAGQAQLDVERREAEERATAANKQNRRLRWLLGGLAVFLALALVAGGLAVFAQSRAEKEARTATARELAAAAVANVEADPELAVLLATRAVEHTRDVDGTVLPEAEEALHRAVVSSRVVATYSDLGGTLDWSPDGSMFVTEGPEGTGVVDVRDPETGRSLRSWIGHDDDVNDIFFGLDGTLATTGDDGAAVAWNPRTGEEVGRIQGPVDDVWGPSLSKDGSLLSAAWQADGARVVDLRSGRLVREISVDGGAVSTALSPDGTRVAVGGWGNSSAVVVDLGSGRELLRLGTFDSQGGRLAWSPDGRWIAGLGDFEARVWDATTGQLWAVLQGHTTFTLGLDWRADSARIATGSVDGIAKVWEITDDGAQQVQSLSAAGTLTSVVGVAFSPDGRRLIAGDEDIKAVMIFDVDLTGNAEWTNVPAPQRFTGVDFFPDGQRIVASSEEVSATIWDSETGRSLGGTGTHGPPDDPATGTHVNSVDASPDGALIATASDRSVKVWDAASGAEVFEYAPAGDMSWSSDSSLLAVSGSEDGVTAIVDRVGRVVGRVREVDGFYSISAGFSPDGAWLATGRDVVPDAARSGVYGVTIWDWRTGQAIKTLEDAWAGSLTFTPDGSKLATSDPAIWDPRTGELLATLSGHTGGVNDVAFSPDGATVATSGEDGTLRLWDAESGVQRLALRGHSGIAHAVKFSPDGTKLASTGSDGVVRVWALDLDDLLRIARDNVTRDLTPAECRQYLHVDSCS
jgi:WD40 repeat protein